MIRYCSICNNPTPFRLRKGNTDYFQCESCKTLFSEPLNQEGLVGGGNHDQRNEIQNPIRLDRVSTMTENMKREDVNVLDFGCGFAVLVNDLKKAGYNAAGYDAYNPDFLRLPEHNKFHVCMMVEVIEHTTANFIELDVINRSLVDGGILYVESGFVNTAQEDNIPLEDFFYIDPAAGHSTVFSHHGMDILMMSKGYYPKRHFCRNSRLYRKVKSLS